MTLSINTNTSAMAALQTLSQTTSALNQTQNQVSTGYAVGSAADNPAVYAIAQTMNSQISALSGVSTGLQYTGQVLNVANSAATNIISTLTNMASAIPSTATGFDADTINSQLTRYLGQIDSFASGASFQGVNLLAGAVGNGVKFTSVSTAQDTNGTIFSQSGFNATSAGLGLSGLSLDESGSQISLGTSTFTATGATATTLQAVNNGAGTAQSPNVSYDFVMDQQSGTQMASGGAVQAVLNNALSAADQVTLSANGTLSSTALASTATSNGVTTYSFKDGMTVTAGTDASGNRVFTASTKFDANGNAIAQTVVTDVNVNAATSASSTAPGSGSVSPQTQQQRNLLMQAMSNSGFNVSADNNNNLTIAGNNINAADTNMGSYTAGTITAGTAVSFSTVSGHQIAIAAIQAALSKMTSVAGNLGAASNQVTQLQGATSSLSNALTTGVGALTDADLAAESAKLTSLQTKQQLAIQSLSIANSQSQTLLSLFRG